jgi:4-amino-4-deoxy-L-arabinose transferase-like glycosyltransferase
MDDSYIRFCEKCEPRQPNKRYLKYLCDGDVAIKNMLWAGLFLGLASLFRPVGHYLLVLAGFMLLFSHDSWRRKLVKFITFAIAWFLPVSFWLIRNVLLTGHLFFHTLPGGHFLYLSAARVVMHTQQRSYKEARQYLHDEVRQELDKKEHELGHPLLEIESCKVHEQLAITYFKQHPLIALKNWYTDMLRTMFSLYSAELLYLESGRQPIDYFKKERSLWDMIKRYLFPQTDSWILRGIVWLEILTFLMTIVGFCCYIVLALWCALRRKFELLCVLCKGLPFMVLFIVIALSGGYARMRLPIEPLLIIQSFSFLLYAGRYQ